MSKEYSESMTEIEKKNYVENMLAEARAISPGWAAAVEELIRMNNNGELF